MASVIGVVMNNMKRRECFVIWIATNTVWMVYDWRIGARAQAAMFALYLVLSVWGLAMWSRKDKKATGGQG